jgi:hypothetical protein
MTGGTDEEQVRALVVTLQQAAAEGRAGVMCDNITAAGVRAAAERAAESLDKKNATCEDGFRGFSEQLVDGPSPKITSVRVDGRKALVKLEDRDGRRFELTAVKRRSRWKVDLRELSGKPQAAPGPQGAGAQP